jgi:hypothetical protein
MEVVDVRDDTSGGERGVARLDGLEDALVLGAQSAEQSWPCLGATPEDAPT